MKNRDQRNVSGIRPQQNVLEVGLPMEFIPLNEKPDGAFPERSAGSGC